MRRAAARRQPLVRENAAITTGMGQEMTRGFRRRRDGRIEVKLSPQELTLLRQVVGEMLGLLSAGEQSGDQADRDPLSRIVGISDTAHAPDDPVLARLFPDGYADDPEAAAEFRRYTEDSLREQKRAAAETVQAGLPEAQDEHGSDSGAGLAGSGRPGRPGRRAHIVLTPEEAQTWLRALNDVRLALGTRLGVTEEAHDELMRMSPDDPRYPGHAAYDWLSFLQETLVRAVT